MYKTFLTAGTWLRTTDSSLRFTHEYIKTRSRRDTPSWVKSKRCRFYYFIIIINVIVKIITVTVSKYFTRTCMCVYLKKNTIFKLTPRLLHVVRICSGTNVSVRKKKPRSFKRSQYCGQWKEKVEWKRDRNIILHHKTFGHNAHTTFCQCCVQNNSIHTYTYILPVHFLIPIIMQYIERLENIFPYSGSQQ